jgi:hypothetical protein
VNIAGELHAALAKVCPIDGVSIGNPKDPSTWKPHFSATATEEQKSLAYNALNAFNASEREQELKAKEKLEEIDLKSIRAIREALTAGPNAPASLALLEAQAQTERVKIKSK